MRGRQNGTKETRDRIGGRTVEHVFRVAMREGETTEGETLFYENEAGPMRRPLIHGALEVNLGRRLP